ncbi:MAG: hypothetical protein KGY65_01510, partial [Candidatus Thermoplasmatota archaeon]|nr:hypothetical protein [Candidatus Thermoplasmatota archaeon]
GNDYAYFYLPTFEVDSNAMEDPELKLPGKDRIVDLDIPPLGESWMIEENLTSEYQSIFAEDRYIENVDVDVLVYVPKDFSMEDPNATPVKVFAKPLVQPTYSQYSLIAEGTLDHNGDICQYDQQEIIANLRS